MNISEVKNILKNHYGNNMIFHIANNHININTLLTDSRNHFNSDDTLFFAIKTEGGNDGHNFIKDLYDKGVRNFIIQYVSDDLKNITDINYFVVPDTIEALKIIGRQHVNFAKEIVAITGSRGKTTLKEIIFQLLEPYKKISRSPRSYNSKIGVPLSLWQISPNSDIAIIEAGISKKDEMKYQSEVINPDTVIFTNIGDAHNNGFSSLEEKAAEKVLLASGNKVKTIIYPKDSILLEHEIKKYNSKKEIISWSVKNPDADLFIKPVNNIIQYTWKKGEFEIETSLLKEYDLENIAGALAFMLKEGISHFQIKESFRNLRRINTRLNVSDGVNGCSLILDSYTSDLSSLLPAIDFMKRRKMPSQSITLIGSDLHHEGQSIEETYHEFARIVNETGVDKFIGIGDILTSYSYLFPNSSLFYSDTESYLDSFSASDFNDEIILLKGSPEFDFNLIFQQLEAKKHETVLEVNLDAILRNYNYFRSLIPSSTGVIAMVKASGYGSGSYEIAKTLQDAGAAYLAVAALDEGIDLRNNGITMPIMVMNPRSANYKALFKNRLQPVIYSLSMLETLIKEAEKYEIGEYPIHIKLDTGMHRMGFLPDEIEKLLVLLKNSRNVKVSTIFSHLATADCLDMDDFTMLQLNRFESISNHIINGLGYHVERHILNSAGIIRFPQYHYEYVRLGIGLYGANTLPPEIEKPLSTVSTLRSVIICIREIEKEETVGYGRKGSVKKVSKIATIPIGYADGMNRKFGNGNIKVLVNGCKVPTIGNICMDATMIDVTDTDCKVGDSVEIFGENINIQSLADTLETIPYEILTSVSPRVKRIYFRE